MNRKRVVVSGASWWFWTVFAAFDLTAAAICAFLWRLCQSAMRDLGEFTPAARDEWPRVSIIVAARNEERGIEAGARSLLALDYPNLQITVVNDRSTDRTAEILGRVAAEDSRLNVVSVSELPAGWLGKNHAMQSGADRSDGEWLLFTDADIVFAPEAVKKGVAYSEEHRVDFLAAVPRVITPSFWLRAFVPVFSMCFLLYVKAWEIRRKDRTAHAGIGAFNLVRREVYRAVGGHHSLKLRPDDDLKLGKVMKASGYQCDLVLGRDLISVEWYSSLGELIRGLEKNTFAGADYRISKVVAANFALFAVYITPFVAAFFTPWPANLMFALSAAIYVVFAGRACHANGQPRGLGLLFPLGMVLFSAIQFRTMFLNLKQGGIRWRDTFYPLQQLRENVV